MTAMIRRSLVTLAPVLRRIHGQLRSHPSRYNYLDPINEQGRKRPLDTPKRMIERREREGERER